MQLTFTPQSGSNRRRFQRWALPLGCARVSLRRQGQQAFTTGGAACDLSWGGVRFEIDHPLEAGETVDLKITTPPADSKLLHATGHVVRFLGVEPDSGQIAVAFTQVHAPATPDDLARLIHQALSSHTPPSAA